MKDQHNEQLLVRLRLSIDLDTEEDARNIGEALEVDDDEFITTSIEGTSVIGSIKAKDISSARRAADDWLACLMSIKGS